jgi:cystathionine beta-lyase
VHKSTRLVRPAAAPGDVLRPTSTPIYQTATFAQPGALEGGPYDYSRSGNPTRDVLDGELARLEGGARGLSYASGMAAVAAVARLCRPGDELVAAADLYGGTQRLFGRLLEPSGVGVRVVDARDPRAVAAALTPRTRLVWVETPSNPLLQVVDLAALADLARCAGAPLVVDNSALSPWLQRPLEHGAQVVVHSATKHLGGHGDVTAGAVVTADEALGEELAFRRNAEGTALGPFDAWLVLRGLKTLGVRVERAQAGARAVAAALARHPAVRRVRYPGLAGHPGRDVHERQAEGPGTLLSFETGDPPLAARVVDALELFTTAVSFGSVASAASIPRAMSHASAPAALRAAAPLGADLVRLSIGLEDPGDLIADLERALGRGARPAGVSPAAPATRSRPA